MANDEDSFVVESQRFTVRHIASIAPPKMPSIVEIMMEKAVVTDSTFSPLDIETELLVPIGLNVIAAQCLTADGLKQAVHDADYVMTQFAQVNADVIESMRRARVIVRYGIGVDNVDLAAARNKGIPVCNVPDYCINEVADHTLALILAATRRVVENAIAVRNGSWQLVVPVGAMKCLNSMVVGIIGFGRIGREVASRLKPFKCRILICDPIADSKTLREACFEPATLDDLITKSDVITLHCPANNKTHHLINATTIKSMKPGVILVNVARGSLVCTEDLLTALRSGHISFAALDVAEMEPLSRDHPLRSLSNVIVHSHIASASEASHEALRRQVAKIVICASRGEPLPNVVNGVS